VGIDVVLRKMSRIEWTKPEWCLSSSQFGSFMLFACQILPPSRSFEIFKIQKTKTFFKKKSKSIFIHNSFLKEFLSFHKKNSNHDSSPTLTSHQKQSYLFI